MVKKNKKWMQVISIICCSVLVSCTQKTMEQSIAEYAVIKVGTSDRTLLTSYSATIRGKQDVDIFPQVSGTITKICVEEGQSVRKGQILFIIDQVPYQAALRTAVANVEVAKAGMSTAQLNYDSRKVLFEKKVVSEFDLKTAENTLLSAKAQFAQAQAQELNARNNLSYTEVKSNSNGVVGMLPYREGTLVSANMPQPLTTISDNSDMYVYFSMNEKQLLELVREFGSKDKFLESMSEIELQLSDRSIYEKKGRIETISGVIDKTTGTVSLRAVFNNENQLLYSGSTGNVIVPTQKKGSIIIPKTATYEIQDKVFAFKVVDGKAKSVPLQVAKFNTGQEYIVENGLKEGDEIISEGVGLLRENTPVKAKQ